MHFSYTIDVVMFAINFFLCLSLKYEIEYDSSYYSNFGKRLLSALSTVVAVSSGVIFLVVMLYPAYPTSGSLVWLLAIIYTIIHQFFAKSSELNDWIASDNFWSKLFGLYYLLRLKEFKQEDMVVLRGFILEYVRSCDQEDTIRTLTIATLGAGSQEGEHAERYRGVLQKIIEAEFAKELRHANKNGDHRSLHETCTLAYSQYLIEICKKTHSSVLELKALRTTTMMNRFYQYRLIRIVEDLQYASDRKGKEFMMLKLSKEEDHLREVVLQEAEATSKLWTYVSTERPEIDEIEVLVRLILDLQRDAKEIWEKAETYNVRMPSLYRVYVFYLESLHGDYIASSRLKSM
ncbi:MAG: hypothetical protein P4M11_02085 [Candidatus Pacebacteria bacterium]|nr:hypothetical protein [Candidatus Paceibacterota bacterium]